MKFTFKMWFNMATRTRATEANETNEAKATIRKSQFSRYSRKPDTGKLAELTVSKMQKGIESAGGAAHAKSSRFGRIKKTVLLATGLTLISPSVTRIAEDIFAYNGPISGEVLAQTKLNADIKGGEGKEQKGGNEPTVSRKDVEKWLSYKFEKKYETTSVTYTYQDPRTHAIIPASLISAEADDGSSLSATTGTSTIFLLSNPNSKTPSFIDIPAQLKEIGISKFSEKAHVEYAGVAKWNDVDCNTYYVWDVGANGILNISVPLNPNDLKITAPGEIPFGFSSVVKLSNPIIENAKFMIFSGSNVKAGIAFYPGQGNEVVVSSTGTIMRQDLSKVVKDSVNDIQFGFEPSNGWIIGAFLKTNEAVAFIIQSSEFGKAAIVMR